MFKKIWGNNQEDKFFHEILSVFIKLCCKWLQNNEKKEKKKEKEKTKEKKKQLSSDSFEKEKKNFLHYYL